VPGIGGSPEVLKAGTAEQGQGVNSSSWSMMLGDNLTIPVGESHEVIVGVQVERIHLGRGGVSNSYGTWTFANLDSLANRAPSRFEINQDFGSASVPLNAAQYGIYAGNSWRASDRLSWTFGLRLDALSVSGHAPYNHDIDSI